MDDITFTDGNDISFRANTKSWAVFIDVDEMFRNGTEPNVWRGAPTVRCYVHGDSRGVAFKINGATHGRCMRCLVENLLASCPEAELL